MKNALIAVCCALALALPAVAAAQEGLSEAEVTAAIEAPAVRQAFESCFAGVPHPATVELDLIITEKGKASLVSTVPEVDTKTFSCFQGAAGLILFKATGKKYEIHYPMEFPEFIAAQPQPQPREATPRDNQPATPEKTPAYATGTVPLAVPADYWRREYNQGVALLVVGLLGTSAGIAAMLAGAVVYAIYKDDPAKKTTGLYTFAGCLAGGLVFTLGGVILYSVGKKKMDQAKPHLVPVVGLAPATVGRGLSATLTWRF